MHIFLRLILINLFVIGPCMILYFFLKEEKNFEYAWIFYVIALAAGAIQVFIYYKDKASIAVNNL